MNSDSDTSNLEFGQTSQVKGTVIHKISSDISHKLDDSQATFTCDHLAPNSEVLNIPSGLIICWMTHRIQESTVPVIAVLL